MVVTSERRGVPETLAELERRMEAAARRLRDGLPDAEDVHECVRRWRAAWRRDAAYQAAWAQGELVRWRYPD